MQTFITVLLLIFSLTQFVFAEQPLVLSALSLDQATKKIIEGSENKVLGAKTERINGKDIHVIKVLSADGRVQYIKIEAVSGKNIK